jgi:hypothetical protein
MLDVGSALTQAARRAAAPARSVRRALVVGAAGALGAAVLEQLLAARRFDRVGALVDQPIRAALRGFVPVDDEPSTLRDFGADTALVVFDRARHAFGREQAFVRPDPLALPALAARLHAAGARTLVVVVPHQPALLPMALQQGLASMDEAAVAALGFERLVFMRMAQGGDADRVSALSAPQRLARWMLSQLHWMVPQREQAVRVETVARVAAALASRLPQASPGTRVLPAALLWQAAQQRDPASLVAAWLEGAAPGGRL